MKVRLERNVHKRNGAGACLVRIKALPANQLGEVVRYIDTQVAAAFVPVDEIADDARDYFDGTIDLGQVSPEYLESLVRKSVAAHQKKQAKWRGRTDCDRLDRAFKALERRGVLARQNWTGCMTDGAYEIDQELAKAKKRGRRFIGSAFYHSQDTESAVEDGVLAIAFAAAGKRTAPSVRRLREHIEVGKKIVDTLREAGLDVEWNGTFETRIFVTLDWRRRRISAVAKA